MPDAALTLPDRPLHFYRDWDVFAREALSSRMQRSSDRVAELLLAGGAMLGGAGLVALVVANRPVIDAKGREWGIDNMSAIAGIGGAVLGAAVGAAVGGLGTGWLMRTLGRHADADRVSVLQDLLAATRREYELLVTELHSRGMRGRKQHKLAVEALFRGLTAEL